MSKFLYGFGFFLMILSALFLVLCVILLVTVPAAGVPAILADLAVMYLGAYWFVTSKRKVEGTDEIKNGTCSVCSAQAPIRQLEFKECKAYLLVRSERSVDCLMCANCADSIYKIFTSTNLKLGWWSLPGLLRTPMMLMFNHVNHRRAKALRSATGPTLAAVQAASPGPLH